MHTAILPLLPPDPREALASQEGYKRRSEQLLAEAETPEERAWAQFCVDNANRNITKWQPYADRMVTQ